ncbi:MAG TPA: hypothetical protein DDW27_18295 [Bacteroidales bacterium]|nr:hypothetical protein [Bacteroidales bacterium]
MHWFLLVILIPYLYILLKIFRNLLKIIPYSPSESPSVFATILTACRNEENNLPLLLGDISLQDYPSGMFEIIVIDDNSSDSTYDTASGFRDLSNLQVYRNKGTGKKAALKTGCGIASGNLIITVDADCRLNRSWLRTIVSFYYKEKPEMIISPVLLDDRHGLFNHFQELEFLSLQGITAGSAVAGDPLMCNGANLSFTKESFKNHSECLHDELISGDDVFLMHNMKKEKQSRILWLESEDAAVITAASSSAGAFLKQRARWLSKAGSYTDFSTKLTAVATLAVVVLQFLTLMAGIFEAGYLVLFAAVFLIKSLPDYLILKNTTSRYKKERLMRWFFISQFIYPFYVLAVISVVLSRKGWRR